MSWVRQLHGSTQIDALMAPVADPDAASLPADFLSNNKIDNTVVLTGDIHTHWVRSFGTQRLHNANVPRSKLKCW